MNTGRGIRDHGASQSPRYLLQQHSRKIENIIRVGRIMDTDYKAGKVRVRVGDKDDEDKIESDWIPWTAGRHSNNRTWDAPEKDEQVMMISPSGILSNAFVVRIAPYDKFQNEASKPEVIKTTYRNDPKSKDTIDALEEFNRKTGAYNFHIQKEGKINLQIGDDAAICVSDEEIQIRNKDTMLSMTKEGIKMFVKKDECTLCLVPESITAQVKQKGIWKLTEELFTAAIGDDSFLKVTKDTITLALSGFQTGIEMGASKLNAMVGTSILSIQQATAKLFAGASAIVTDAAGVLVTSPTFQGLMGSGVPGNFDASEYEKPDKDDKPDNIEEPPTDTGYTPYRPKAEGTSV